MSKHRERPPLRIRPQPSRLLAVFLSAAHGAALAVAFALPLDWHWRVGLALLVLSGLAYGIGAQVLYLVPWTIREATWTSDGAWTLNLVSGEKIQSRLLPSTYVSLRLVVLNFRGRRLRARALVLLPDALDVDTLRRLRVRLRLWGAAIGSDRDDPA